MHASGIGKALLAGMAEPRAARIIAAQGLEAFTEHSLITPERLARDLSLSRARGYAVDNEEKTLGMRCIAAPVFDMHGEAAAGISVSGPTSRIGPDQIEPLSRPVIAAARALTAAIGGVVTPRSG